MLQKPDLDDNLILRALESAYGLRDTQLSFLPLGLDVNAAVYKASTADNTPYFVKLRRGAFDSIALEVPTCLHEQGIADVMAPLATAAGKLWVDLHGYRLMLYPFVDGCNGYEADLTDGQWRSLGRALRAVHSAQLPDRLLRCIPQETYPATGRELIRTCMVRHDLDVAHDDAAKQLRKILRERSEVISQIVSRAEELAAQLLHTPRPYVLCHSDIHAGNVLLGADDALAIVDWDNPLLAPKERDLMYIGAWGSWSNPHSVRMFYEGYGATEIDQIALVYYRYEHFAQDLYEWCKMLLLSPDGGEDRDQAIQYLEGCFTPDGEATIALLTDSM